MIEYIKKNALNSAEGHLPCVKQSVYAMIETLDGDVIFGTNKMLNDIEICPRETESCKTGEGYHLCKDVCNQINHAEVDAIENAVNNDYDLRGSTLTLVGHTYCCENCLNTMKLNNISNVNILNDDGSILDSFEI